MAADGFVFAMQMRRRMDDVAAPGAAQHRRGAGQCSGQQGAGSKPSTLIAVAQ